MTNNLREGFYNVLNPGNSTPITSNQQCHLVQHQAHQNQSNNLNDLMIIIQVLKNEVKALKENKENIDPRQRRIKKRTQVLLDLRMQRLSSWK